MILSIDTSHFGTSLLIGCRHAKNFAPEGKIGKIGDFHYLTFETEAVREFSLPIAISALYARARLTPKDISKILITLGPGSYTGIRSGLAVISAYQLAMAEIEIFGIDNFTLTAHGFAHHHGNKLIILESKRQDFYWQRFNHQNLALERAQHQRARNDFKCD